MDLYLSSKSLKNIKESGFDDDFELEICGETIHCSKFVASFISPKISRKIRVDPTITKYIINFSEPIMYSNEKEIKSEIKSSDFINKFQRFIEGEGIQIEKGQKKSANLDNTNKSDKTIETTTKLLLEIGHSLENDEIIDSICSQLFESELNEINSENYQEKIRIYRLLGSKKMNEKIIEFISSNLSEIVNENEIEKLKEMSQNELEEIFSSSSLKIESEDWLFEIIYSLGREFYFLFDYVEVQYLSIEKVKQLVELIDDMEVDLHHLLWSSICRRLIIDPYQKNEMKNPRCRKVGIECEQGIFNFLSQTANNNIYTSKVIDVKSSQIEIGTIECLFDHSKDTYFRVMNSSERFILFDFKTSKVRFIKYFFSVPSSNTGASNGRPKTWKIEGSNDEQHWDEIDSIENDSSLNGYSKSNTFTCKSMNKNFYQFIRIKCFADHDNTNRFMFSEVEFYGSIKK